MWIYRLNVDLIPSANFPYIQPEDLREMKKTDTKAKSSEEPEQAAPEVLRSDTKNDEKSISSGFSSLFT